MRGTQNDIYDFIPANLYEMARYNETPYFQCNHDICSEYVSFQLVFEGHVESFKKHLFAVGNFDADILGVTAIDDVHVYNTSCASEHQFCVFFFSFLIQ